MQREVRRSIISGRLRAPPSAAVAHRAIIAASLADGQSVISNAPLSKNMLATIGACNSIGADIVAEKGTVDVLGGGEITIPGRLDCAESNTTLKLFMGMLSHFGAEVSFSGSGALLVRSLRPFTAYLERLSAQTLNPSKALPLQLRGPINSGEMVYFPRLGTQFLSGILLGAPVRAEGAEIGITGEFADRNCLDATIGIMKKAGIEFIANESDYIVLQGGQGYSPMPEFEVPGSRASSSYLLLAGALAGKCVLEGAPPFPEFEVLLTKFGAFSRHSEGSFTSGAGVLEAAELDISLLGPLIPHAAVFSCIAKGDSKLLGFSRLRPPQRTRVRRLSALLSRMGAEISEIPDGLLIRGGRLHGAAIDPEGDPRAAMAVAAAALCAEGPTTISGAECVDAAYPEFFRDLVSLGAIVR